MKLKTGEWFVIVGMVVIVAFAVLVGILIFLKPPPVQYVYLESEATKAGEAVYRSQGCAACHKIFGNGTIFGPSLDGIGSRRSYDWLRRYVRQPWPDVSDKPYRLKMPPSDNLAEKELNDLANYLGALRKVASDDSLGMLTP